MLNSLGYEGKGFVGNETLLHYALYYIETVCEWFDAQSHAYYLMQKMVLLDSVQKVVGILCKIL